MNIVWLRPKLPLPQLSLLARIRHDRQVRRGRKKLEFQKQLRRELYAWMSLSSIPYAIKKSNVRVLAEAVRQREMDLELLDQFGSKISGILSAVLGLATIGLAFEALESRYDSSAVSMSALSGYLAVFLVSVLLDKLKISNIRSTYRRCMLAVVGSGLIVMVIASCKTSLNHVFTGHMMAFGAMSALSGLVFLFISELISIIYRVFLESRQNSYPVEYLTLCLFDAIWMLEHGKQRWCKPKFRSRIVAILGRAATIMRYHLFKQFDLAQDYSRSHIKALAASYSDALLEKQMWLVTPKENTRETLLERLSQTIVAYLEGRWDSFEQRSQANPAKQNRFQALSSSLKVLMLGFLPLATFEVSNRFLNMEVPKPISSYINFALLAWAILSVITAFDTSVSQRVSTFRDVMSALRSPDKKE